MPAKLIWQIWAPEIGLKLRAIKSDHSAYHKRANGSARNHPRAIYQHNLIRRDNRPKKLSGFQWRGRFVEINTVVLV